MKTLNAAILLCALGCTNSSAWAQSITIYTATFLPPIRLEGEPAHMIWLDRPEQMVQGLSRHSRQTAGKAPHEILKIIRGAEGEDFFRTLNEQVTGLVAAAAHGIQVLPAIVFEDRFVLYGLYSVSEARARVEAYRAREVL